MEKYEKLFINFINLVKNLLFYIIKFQNIF